jgi:hypothetical protein
MGQLIILVEVFEMTIDVCNDAVRMALEETQRKCHASKAEDVVEGLKDSKECYHGYFRFYLVRHVLDCLASKVRGMRAIYIFDGMPNDDIDLVSAIDLLLYVSKKDPKMKKTMEGLNEMLTQSYCELLGLKLKDSFRLLHLHFITDKDIKERSSAAAMLGSIQNPPMLVWKSGKGVCKA